MHPDSWPRRSESASSLFPPLVQKGLFGPVPASRPREPSGTWSSSHPTGVAVRPVPERPVSGVHQTLAALVEENAVALLVHGIAERHAGAGIGEAQRAAHAGVAEGLLRQEETVP